MREASAEEKRHEKAVEQYGFDPNDLVTRLLNGKKEKEKG
jgi:ACDE family multidrug resistance protein